MRVVFAGVALAVAALVFTGAAPSAEEEVRCRGALATIVGTNGDDLLRGTPSRDVIWGGPGEDRIYGTRGNDILCGGPGDDLISGGRGNDFIDGGPGTDLAFGGLGDDTVLGGSGDGDDVSGGLGIDMVNGGPGNFDRVRGDYGWDRMDGGPGRGDIASFATAVAAANGAGVWASLAAGKARGDGRDRLFRFDALEGSAFRDVLIGNKRANTIDGGPGDDTIRGGGGRDLLIGRQGSDRCSGAKGNTLSCGPEKAPTGSAYVEVMSGGGLVVVGGNGVDDITLSFDEASSSYGVAAAKGIALGPGCTRPSADLAQAVCPAAGNSPWLMADGGRGDDRIRVEGSLSAIPFVRLAGGPGDDVLRGGPEDDLIEAGPGSDRLYGGAGADALIGGLPGPTILDGGPDGDLLAAGGGCAGGAMIGGPGRDNASFAETQAHPGLLIISLPAGKAWIDVLVGRDCPPVRIDSATVEDIEGSFDDDVLVGDRRANNMLGQPGRDRFYGGGGDDVIDARDGVRDFVVRCGRGRPSGRALIDAIDPAPTACAIRKKGEPIKGLHNPG